MSACSLNKYRVSGCFPPTSLHFGTEKEQACGLHGQVLASCPAGFAGSVRHRGGSSKCWGRRKGESHGGDAGDGADPRTLEAERRGAERKGMPRFVGGN